MNRGRQGFTLKIILSYLVLGALAVFVCIFLYNELKDEFNPNDDTGAEKKYIETGSLLISLYEADRFSKIALLTLKEEDFESYLDKNDSLYGTIDYIKGLTSEKNQKQQLDSIKILLRDKEDNIAELRSIKLKNTNDASLDAILKEFKNLENNLGKLTVENFVANPNELTKTDLRQIQRYVDYMNRNRLEDSISVPAAAVDSILSVTRYIVSGAKRTNRQLRASLLEKESELIADDLTISEKIQQMMYAFDGEIASKQFRNNQQKAATVSRSSQMLQIAAILGGVVILLFSYWLITDFFKAEKLKNKLQKEKKTTEALLRSREQLIATVSHDLKTPLSTITGYTELFKSTSLSEKQAYYNANIGDNAAYIANLATDLLDLSKLEAGKLRLEKTSLNLDTIVKKIAADQQALHKEKPIKVIVSIDEKLETATYLGDSLRIRQIITNLVSNAFKFTSEGEIEIAAQLISENPPSDRAGKKQDLISIAVRDTGIGIEKEKQGQIFREFTQAEEDTSQRYGGSGLGLTISKKLAILLEGNLEVDSQPDKGSIFTCVIPLERTEKEILPIPSEKKSVTNLTGIIIDDDSSMLHMLEELFVQLGFTPKIYSQLSDITEEAISESDFILTDMQMPIQTGFDVLSAVKEGDFSNFKEMPVILMTGDRLQSRDFYLKKGFSEMLRKPFKPSELQNVLVRLFPCQQTEESSKTITQDSEEKEKNTQTDYDLGMLRDFMGSDAAVKDILKTFLIQSENDLAQLKEAVIEENHTLLQSIAHKMLTMWRQLQATKIVSLLEQFEQNDIALLDTLTLQREEEKLQKEIKKVTAQLKST